MFSVLYAWSWWGVYARDGADTGGMVDQLIPTSEILPKHLHITKCSDTQLAENMPEILSANIHKPHMNFNEVCNIFTKPKTLAYPNK